MTLPQLNDGQVTHQLLHKGGLWLASFNLDRRDDARADDPEPKDQVSARQCRNRESLTFVGLAKKDRLNIGHRFNRQVCLGL